jgi:membrane dipeptidase
MASHSDCWAISPHFRNLKDDQIRALAAQGGIIGINFYCSFLSAEFMRKQMAAEAKLKTQIEALEAQHPYDFPVQAELGWAMLRAEMGPVPVPATLVVDHVAHIVRLVGSDHVALGSDFDGTAALPDDLPDAGAMPRVTHLLHERGFSERDIRKILGENVLRFFDTVCG